MEEKFQFTPEESAQVIKLLMALRGSMEDFLQPDDLRKLRDHLNDAASHGYIHRDVFGLNPILHALQTAKIAVEEIGCCHNYQRVGPY